MPLKAAVLVLDFDGTLTTTDVGDDLCERFAPPDWRLVDQRYQRGELSLPDAQRLMWGMLRITREEAIDGAHFVGALRPGLDALLDAAAHAGVECWIASGGFDFYIEALLGERLGRFARIYTNHMRFEEGRLLPEFASAALACRRCAVCKGKVCALPREAGARVMFVGDGHSDRCVLDHAAPHAAEKPDRLAAVRGSVLARWAVERGVACQEFDRLDELSATVAALAEL